MCKQIFIGGTGRSGTSILYQLLRTHRDIFAFPREMRFIIDYNGIVNLVDALTYNFSTIQGEQAIYYFEELMYKHLVNKYTAPYKGFNFKEIFGEKYYIERLNRFVAELTAYSFYGTNYSVPAGYYYNKFSLAVRIMERIYFKLCKILKKRILAEYFWPHQIIKHAKYFDDRRELSLKAGTFINDLFMQAAKKEGKSIWCEKTPHNIFHLDFLYEVLPEHYFIHIKRNPIGVVQSMQNQFWAPKKLEDSCMMLKHLYKKWFSLRERINFKTYRYLEMKIEDLSSDYENQVMLLTDYLGVKHDFNNPPVISGEKVDYWKQKMLREDIQTVERILGEEIKMMGY